MTTTHTITYSGGFHGIAPLNLRVRVVTRDGARIGQLSEWQTKKLDRAFCPGHGCTCGGRVRASVDLNGLDGLE